VPSELGDPNALSLLHGRVRRFVLGERGTIAGTVYGTIIVLSVLSVLAVTLGAVGLIDDQAAVWTAFGLGIITLAAQGVRYARLERLSRIGTIVTTVSVNLALGLTIVAMEVFVAH